MPGGDRTGPAGMGSMTGRGGGYCAGYPVPGFMNPYGGRFGGGFGWGRGRGRGLGYPAVAPYGAAPYGNLPYEAPYSREQEQEQLQNQVKVLEDQLSDMRSRIEELGAEASKEVE